MQFGRRTTFYTLYLFATVMLTIGMKTLECDQYIFPPCYTDESLRKETLCDVLISKCRWVLKWKEIALILPTQLFHCRPLDCVPPPIPDSVRESCWQEHPSAARAAHLKQLAGEALCWFQASLQWTQQTSHADYPVRNIQGVQRVKRTDLQKNEWRVTLLC